MKTLEKWQLFFTLNNRESPQLLTEDQFGNKEMRSCLESLILKEDYFNSSYYGDPFAYDWNCGDFDDYKRGG